MRIKLHAFVSVLLVASAALAPSVSRADPPEPDTNGPDRVLAALKDQQLLQASTFRSEGDAFLKSKKYDKAIKAYNDSLFYNEMHSDTYAGLAEAYRGKGNYRQAVANYRKAIGDIPDRDWVCSRENDGDLQIRFALLLSQLGRYDQALVLYQIGYGFLSYEDKEFLALTMTPQTFDKAVFESTAHAALGFKYEWEGRTEEALPQLTEAVRLAPKSAVAHYYLGFFHKVEDQRAEARAEYTKAMELGRGALKQKAAERLGLSPTAKSN